jgi:hypothetical protein
MQKERRIRQLRPCPVSARPLPFYRRSAKGNKKAATDALGCRSIKSKDYLLFGPCECFSPL